ncbi:arsenate reductase family protein [uncultured Methanobrevibacter sp.]|uniref:arsenate reductase family protein n=1 Tax=uncultured Methanobrevibacter sp. TaxID=253161 RepID=UPI0025CD9792|nr:arsenate reductase family protein [uncultured Methanobrevibacter sp.]
MLFVNYPKCSTCRKAKNWLEEHDIEFESRHIVEDNPTAQEIEEWWKKSDLPLKRFFNTSGQVYRKLGLKDKLPDMSEEEQFEILSTDGMLVKRPILVGDDFVLVGFKIQEWEEKLL